MTTKCPANLLLGVATSDYQIEGAWDEDGKGESNWDRWSHTAGHVKNGDTGDTACDHYHRYPDDIAIMRQLGLEAYRFGISWSRVFPEGGGRLNEKGLAFYERLVDALLEADIIPFPTLYHWTNPQALEEKGGWQNREMVERFAEYCSTVTHRLGDRVKSWLILNEPWVVMYQGYNEGLFPPGIKDPLTAIRVGHNLNLAQGLASKAIRSQRSDLKLGSAFDMAGVYPATQSEEDRKAAERMEGFKNYWFLDPILLGRYPKVFPIDVQSLVGTIDWKEVQANLDFIGINLYSRLVVAHDASVPWINVRTIEPKNTERTDSGWEIYPEAMRQVVLRTSVRYKLPIFITETGCACNDKPNKKGEVVDQKRVDFLRRYLREVALATNQGADIRGCFVWSLLDNFEWLEGYSLRFGLTYVDYTTQKRIIKESGRWFANLIRTRLL